MVRKMGGKGSGRKIKYNDEWHKTQRERQRKYTKENREAWNLGAKEEISIAEARKRLGIKFVSKKQHGTRKQTRKHEK